MQNDSTAEVIQLQNNLELLAKKHNEEVNYVYEEIGKVIDLLSDQNEYDFEQKAIDILSNISLSTFLRTENETQEDTNV